MKPRLILAALTALLIVPAQLQAQDNSGSTMAGSSAAPAAPAAPETPAAAPAEDPAVELVFWDSIKDSNNPDLFLAYLQRYPNGVFRVIAEERLKEIYSAAGDQTGSEPAAPPASDEGAASSEATTVVTPPATQVITVAPTVQAKPAKSYYTIVKGVQRQLRRLGCYYGAVDGVWGPKSRAAARRFNRSYSAFNIAVQRPNANGLAKLKAISGRVCY